MTYFPFDNPRVDQEFNAPNSYGVGLNHEGWDMSVDGTWGNQDLGTPIRCVYPGKIIHTSTSTKNYGKLVVVESKTPNGTRWHRYCHLYRRVLTSEFLKRGDIIGYMGSSGFSTAAHLHFDLLRKRPPHWRYYNSNILEWFEDPHVLMNLDIIESTMPDWLVSQLRDQLKIDVTSSEGDVRGRIGEIVDKLRRLSEYEKRITKLEKEVAFAAGEAAKFEEELRISYQSGERLEKEISELKKQLDNRDNELGDLRREVETLKETLDPETKIVIDRSEYERLTRKKVLDRFSTREVISELFKRIRKKVFVK